MSSGAELKRANRKKISEALLAERLGLTDEWQNVENLSLPVSLPPSGKRKTSKAESFDLKRYIDELGTLGCDRQVVYWCLEQTGHTVEMARMGAMRRGVAKPGEDDLDVRVMPNPSPTSDDMVSLESKFRAALEGLRRHQDELVMTADVLLESPKVPWDLMEVQELTPDDAVAILRSLLHWATRIAQAWPAPNLKTLMRSKGLLFLLAYVHMCERRGAMTKNGTKKGPRRATSARLSVRHVHTIVHIALLYTGEPFSADNLVDKLQDFQREYPALSGRMNGLLENLEEIARRNPRR